MQAVTLNVSGRDLKSFVQDARAQILAKVGFPAGSYFEFAGTAAAEAQSRRDVLTHSLLAGLGIVLLLSIVMMNFRNLLLVLANIPFALIGGVLAVFAMGGETTIPSPLEISARTCPARSAISSLVDAAANSPRILSSSSGRSVAWATIC